jgi:hypothetical protein
VKRIINHWDAGWNNRVSPEAHKAYHEIILADGSWHPGRFPVEANKAPIRGNAETYAAHTRNANGDSIGLAVAGMVGSREVPFNPGPSPINMKQIQVLAQRNAYYCRRFGIPVTRQTVLTHAEVERTLGIKQRPRWDIVWLPDMQGPGDAIAVGDRFRAMVAKELSALDSSPAATRPAPAAGNFFARLFAAIFGGR